MGNRATMTVKGSGVEIYLHWNGGRASIEGFCQACKELGFRSPAADHHYASAYLVAVCGVFFGDGLSLGVAKTGTFAAEDNGNYEIGGNWEVVKGRRSGSNPEQSAEIARRIVAAWKASQEAKKA